MKILFTVNGTPKSESIIPFVVALARRWQAEVLIARGVDPSSGVAEPVAAVYTARLLQELVRAGNRYLKDLQARFPDVPTRTFCLTGWPGHSIRQLAAEERCDLLVMASHGHTGFVRWLWGSMAEGMARTASCPVLLVRAQTPESFQRILVPFDGSDPSWNVLEHLRPFIEPGSAGITLLHCLDPKDLETLENPGAREREYRLRCELKNMADADPTLRLEFASSPAREGIDRWLKDNPCDLVAMSTHGRSGLAHLWRGSVMEHVARTANCPVMVFPSALVQDQTIA